MRATYVQPEENLTFIGNWLAARAPHIDRSTWFFRVFGFKPFYRFVIFDWTTYSGDWHLTIMGIRLKQNHLFRPRA